MRFTPLLLVCLAAAGCATQPRAAKVGPAPPAGTDVTGINLHPQMVTVETRYEIAGYYDPADPSIWHAAHAVCRQTEVARAQAEAKPPAEIGALTTFVPSSYDPLPPSAQLAAELAGQKEITAELRALKSRMVTLQGQAEAQYAQLVADRQTTDELRQKLQGEWAQAKARISAKGQPGSPPLANASPASTPPVNW